MSHVGTVTNNSLLGEVSKFYLAQPCIIASKWASNVAAGLLKLQERRSVQMLGVWRRGEEIIKDVGSVETGGGDHKRSGECGDGGRRS